jgi:predicted amidohydrolase YtcJ
VFRLNPWCIIYYMATGTNVSGELTNADETGSRYEAVRYYSSVEQGWFTKEDDTLGGIDVGRFADIAVLSADVFDPDVVSDADIRHMTSVLTIVGGEIVHDAGVLDTP